MEDSRQSKEHGVTLLLHRRKITADAAKSDDASRTAKGARNLLLDFGPAQVPLGLIVRKRNAQVVEQSQHLFCTPKQRIQQILGLALLGLAFPFSSRRRWWWLSRIASGQDLEIARDPVVALDGRNSRQVEQTKLVAGVMQIEQEVLHLGGPLLLLLLGDGGTIAFEMGSTDTVSTVIGIIADQPIVHTSSTKAWPDPDFVHSLPTSRPMPRQMRQEAGAVHMQPMQHAIDADARLISMLERAGHDQLGNALHRRRQPLGGHLAPLDQGSFRDVAATQCLQRLTGARRGQQLPLVQIHGQRLQVGTVLHWRANRSGKAAQAGAVTAGATDGFDLMFVYQEVDFRHIQHLTAFCQVTWDLAEILTALAAHLGTVTQHGIW